MTTLYKGSCHCGRTRFEVEGELSALTDCNCSICQRKGALLWFVPRASLRLLTADDQLAIYTFNKGHIRHRFCPICGIHPLGEGSMPDGMAMAAINVRCLDDVDFSALPVRHFDGRSL